MKGTDPVIIVKSYDSEKSGNSMSKGTAVTKVGQQECLDVTINRLNANPTK